MRRSVLAVVAGYLFLTVLSRSASYVLAFVFPPVATASGALGVPTSLYVATVLAGFLAALAGGHVCARLAGRAEATHVAVLAGTLAAIGVALLVSPPAGIPRTPALVEVGAGVVGVLAGGALRALARQE